MTISVSAEAARPTAPAATDASAPRFTLLDITEFAPHSFITTSTRRSFSSICPTPGRPHTKMATTSKTLYFINPPFEGFSTTGSIHGTKDKTRLLPFRLWGSHSLREAFQRNLARVGRSLLRFVA